MQSRSKLSLELQRELDVQTATTTPSWFAFLTLHKVRASLSTTIRAYGLAGPTGSCRRSYCKLRACESQHALQLHRLVSSLAEHCEFADDKLESQTLF